MRNILIIEDELQIVHAIESRLRDKYPYCEIEKASNFYRAQTALDKYLENNGCNLIISDLHMSGEGLDSEVCIDRPDGSVLNGWIFLRDYLLKEGAPYYSISAKTPIIIFSAFLEELRAYTNSRKEDSVLLLNVMQIPKGRIYSGDGGYTELMKVVTFHLK